MAVRVRSSGEVVCAAMHPEQEGDRYIDDGLHYRLAVELRVLVTEPMILEEGEGLGGHSKHGLWWWRGEEDDRAAIDQFYREDPEDDAEPEPPELTEEERQKRPPAHVGVGMPGWITLNLFGRLVRDAFPGAIPYLVGSAARGKEWRDVDVRLMVTADQYERWVGEGWRSSSPNHEAATEPNYFDAMQENSKVNSMPTGRRRTAVTLAFAELGRQMTGMPVDFQFDLYDPDEPLSQRDGPRVALGGVVGGFAD